MPSRRVQTISLPTTMNRRLEQWTSEPRLLAIDPTTRGFAYASFEGPRRLIDWGSVQVRGDKRTGSLVRAGELMDRLRVAVLVVEDPKDPRSRRATRVRQLLFAMEREAKRRGVSIRRISREEVRRAFRSSGTTKHEIALRIAEDLPELAPRLPRKRKPWESEAERMSIFDAAAFALTALVAVDEGG